jgi:hypothetical protein
MQKVECVIFGIINTHKRESSFSKTIRLKGILKKISQVHGGFYKKQKMAGSYSKITILLQITPIYARSAHQLTP